MSDKTIIMIAALCFMAIVVFCTAKYGATLPPERPAVFEITLTDGTPCVIHQNGGIACNWKETGK